MWESHSINITVQIVGWGKARSYFNACYPRPHDHNCRQQTARWHRLRCPILISEVRPSCFWRHPRCRISTARKYSHIHVLCLHTLIYSINIRFRNNFPHRCYYSSIELSVLLMNHLPPDRSQLLFVGAIEYGFSRVQKSIEEDCSQYMDGLGWSAEKQGEQKYSFYWWRTDIQIDICNFIRNDRTHTPLPLHLRLLWFTFLQIHRVG